MSRGPHVSLPGAGSLVYGTIPSFLMWLLGIQIHTLKVQGQALPQQRHLPSLKGFLEFSVDM